MEKLLAEILQNADSPIEVKTKNLFEIIDQVKQATGLLIKHKPSVWTYFNDEGYPRQRKPANTYLLSI